MLMASMESMHTLKKKYTIAMWLSLFGIATLQWIINTSRINDNDPEIWLQMMDNSPIVEEVLNNDIVQHDDDGNKPEGNVRNYHNNTHNFLSKHLLMKITEVKLNADGISV